MNCAEAAECVSALFDGEPVSREAAAHLSDCEECRARLNEYAEMSANMRDLASAAAPRTIPEGQWKLAEPAAAKNWLTKWRGTMRIPRFAFALMLIAIFALSGGLGLLKARPGGTGPVLLLTFKIPPKGETLDCAVRTDREPDSCAFFKGNVPGDLAVAAKFIKREGERIQLGIKANFVPEPQPSGERSITFPLNAFDMMPEEVYWLEPDKKLIVQVPGLGSIEVSGEFLDHMPVLAMNPRAALAPAQDEFRFVSPVLIRDNQVVVNLAGGSATATGSDPAVILFSPGSGRFIFSPVRFQGAIEARLHAGQVGFTLAGKEYLLLTGAPITRSEHVWVLHQPGWRRPASDSNASDGPFIESAGSVQVFLKTE
jgi:hypothetical protein